MRTTADRIRHALSFELIGIALVVPLGAWLFNIQAHEMGVVAVISATIATSWNYIYNLCFDKVKLHLTGTVEKSVLTRVFHAILFEAGLLIVLIPFIAYWLQLDLWTAFMMDLGIAGFYLVYAFVFNWLYDIVFPIPSPRAAH